MNRQTFFYELRKGLAGLPKADVEKTVEYYNEVIDDRIEEGLSESEAVATLGPVDQIVPQILADVSLPQLVRDRISKTRKFRAWEIVLLIVGAPLWFPLLLTAIILIFTLFLVIWILILTLYIIVLTFGLSGIASIVFSVIGFVAGDLTQGLLWLGTGLLMLGLTVLLLLASSKLAAALAGLSRKILHAMKNRLAGKGAPS